MKSLEYQGEKSVDTENNMQSLGLQNTPAIGVVCTQGSKLTFLLGSTGAPNFKKLGAPQLF